MVRDHASERLPVADVGLRPHDVGVNWSAALALRAAPEPEYVEVLLELLEEVATDEARGTGHDDAGEAISQTILSHKGVWSGPRNRRLRPVRQTCFSRPVRAVEQPVRTLVYKSQSFWSSGPGSAPLPAARGQERKDRWNRQVGRAITADGSAGRQTHTHPGLILRWRVSGPQAPHGETESCHASPVHKPK